MATKDDHWVRLQRGPASRLSRWWMNVAEGLDRRIGWDKLPLALSIPTLIGLRDRLRHENLFDTGVPEERGGFSPGKRTYRTVDGTWNDLAHPMMGSVGTRFGRNVRPANHVPESEPALLTPNPRTVSRTLLTRDQFIPATTLVLLRHFPELAPALGPIENAFAPWVRVVR